MRELSIFADESGDSLSQSKYYLLTLVFHDQDDDIVPNIPPFVTQKYTDEPSFLR
jgi:hypothetical protein